MFKGAILTFICCILFIVTGKPNLIFLESTKKLVSSIKIIRNGTSLTVTCLIEDLKNKRKSSDSIFWINDDLRQRSETNSITLYKPGTYYCICDKYKLVRRLHLVVRDEHDFVRRKRSQHQFESHPIIPPINYPDSLRDLLEGRLNITSNINNNSNVNDYFDKYLANLHGGSIVRNNNNYDPNFRDNLHSIYQGFPMEPYTALPPINYSDSVRDLLQGLSKTTTNTNNNSYVNDYIGKYLKNVRNNSNFDYFDEDDPNYKDKVHSIHQDIPRDPHPVITPINYPDSIKEILEGLSKQTSNTNNNNLNDYIDKYLANSGGGSIINKNNNYNPYSDIPSGSHPVLSPINIPDPVRDFFEGPSKTSSNINSNNNNNNVNDHLNRYLPNSGGGSIVSNNNNYNYNPNYRDNHHTVYQDSGVQFESNNDESHPIYVPQHKDGFNVIYFFAIVLAFVVISVLIYCLSKRRNEPVTNATTNDNGAGVTSNTNNQIEYCSHIFCERYRNTSPEISCYLARLNSSDHMPLSTIDHDNGGVTVLTSLILNNDTVDSSSARPYSDSPPAYGISTRNLPLHSTENVPNELDLPPPSYHQAVANMNLDPPPDFDSSVDEIPLSTTSTSLLDATRTRAPLERP